MNRTIHNAGLRVDQLNNGWGIEALDVDRY